MPLLKPMQDRNSLTLYSNNLFAFTQKRIHRVWLFPFYLRKRCKNKVFKCIFFSSARAFSACRSDCTHISCFFVKFCNILKVERRGILTMYIDMHMRRRTTRRAWIRTMTVVYSACIQSVAHTKACNLDFYRKRVLVGPVYLHCIIPKDIQIKSEIKWE